MTSLRLDPTRDIGAWDLGIPIKGIAGMTVDRLNEELLRGAKFVMFQYCISVLIMTFKRRSSVYFVRAGEGTAGAAFGYTSLSLLFGWWGIPWGIIYTLETLAVNLGGGKDVTKEVLATILSVAQQYEIR